MVSPSGQIRVAFREKKNARDLILVAFFGHPTKLHESEAVVRPSHRDFVGTLELAAKMEVWRPGFGVPLET